MKNEKLKIKNQKIKQKDLSLITYHLSHSYGFTLLEIIVSLGIIAVIGTVVAQTFFATTRTSTKAEVLKEVKQNGDFAVGVMERMIRNAQTNSITCSNKTVSITNPDGDNTTFGCGLDGTVTRIASVSATATQYLTGLSVTLGGSDCSESSLDIACNVVPGIPTNVTIKFTLNQKGTSPLPFEQGKVSFQASVTARN